MTRPPKWYHVEGVTTGSSVLVWSFTKSRMIRNPADDQARLDCCRPVELLMPLCHVIWGLINAVFTPPQHGPEDQKEFCAWTVTVTWESRGRHYYKICGWVIRGDKSSESIGIQTGIRSVITETDPAAAASSSSEDIGGRDTSHSGTSGSSNRFFLQPPLDLNTSHFN